VQQEYAALLSKAVESGGRLIPVLLERPGKSRLLVTCRHPLPLEGVAARKLRDHHLGPLSFAETRKLLWRLSGLDEALATAVTLTADDVLLESLLERLAPVPLAERLLVGASVYRPAVPGVALVRQAGEVPGLPRDPEPDPFPEMASPEGWGKARRALEELGLLAPVDHGGGELFAVHRWTASRLAERVGEEELKEAHRRAALFWRWHFAAISSTIEALLEGRHHHHRAGERDEAVLVTEWVCVQFETWGMYRREEQLIHEVLSWVPERSEKAATFYHQLGNVAYFRGDYDRALEEYRKALEILEELGNRAGMASSYHQLGIVDQERGNYDEALAWYRESLEIKEELGNREGMAISYHQLGIVDQERGNYDQALAWYRKSLEIKEELGNRAGMASSYGQFAVLLLATDRPEEAVPYTLRSLSLHLELQSPNAAKDLDWLGRQREALGDERFRELLDEHLGSEGAEAVLGMLEAASAGE